MHFYTSLSKKLKDMKQKILYVEDEPHLGKIVTDLLVRQGFEVLLITDGAEVIKSFKCFIPDVCVLDIMLPGVDGLELALAIRNRYSHLPIIFLSAKSQTDDVLKGFESGGNDYIKKPFSIDELVARIKNQLKIAASSSLDKTHRLQEVKIRDIIFYPEKYELHIQKRVIKLSYREGQILSALTSTPNKIIDRKALLISVWGDDSYYNSRTLDVYVRKLREYFSAVDGIEIHTLKGKGYTFITD